MIYITLFLSLTYNLNSRCLNIPAMISKAVPLAALAVVLTPVRVEAQQPIYAQCGGTGYTGATTCATGLVCSSLGPYYSQCLSGAATVTPTSTTKTTTTSSTTLSTITTAPTTTTGTVTAASGNPFSGYQIYANPYYSSEIYTSAIPSLTASLATKASAVAKVGTFVWLDTAAKVRLFL